MLRPSLCGYGWSLIFELGTAMLAGCFVSGLRARALVGVR